LKEHPEVTRRKMLDPRAFESSKKGAAAVLGQLVEELRTVRVDYRSGDVVCFPAIVACMALVQCSSCQAQLFLGRMARNECMLASYV
jgi:hypothetical protein